MSRHPERSLARSLRQTESKDPEHAHVAATAQTFPHPPLPRNHRRILHNRQPYLEHLST
jgi:hypothetical protein